MQLLSFAVVVVASHVELMLATVSLRHCGGFRLAVQRPTEKKQKQKQKNRQRCLVPQELTIRPFCRSCHTTIHTGSTQSYVFEQFTHTAPAPTYKHRATADLGLLLFLRLIKPVWDLKIRAKVVQPEIAISMLRLQDTWIT